MQILIDTLHVLQRHLLPQHHLVEGTDEERVQETAMENCQTDYSADELEVVQMLRVDARVGINLEGIVVVSGVFEETVERIEHFVGKEEEEFTARELDVAQIKDTKGISYRERPP
jgi:hypothetical protein